MSKSENEYTIEGEFESPVAVYLTKAAVEGTEKLYGPIYDKMASKYALEFESRMLKEKTPENIQGLEAVTNYIIANLNRYPRGYCPLVYGISKAESELQGFAGSSGSKIAAYSAVKNMLENTGLLNSLIGTTEDIFEASKAFGVKVVDELAAKGSIIIKGKQVQRMHHIRVEGKNQEIVILSNCQYKDTCRALVDEGISRIIGGLNCINLSLGRVVIEIITRKRFDYILEEFDEPDCRGRIFEV
jgi:hypothetical protein